MPWLEGRAEHGSGAHQRLDLGAGPPDPREHRLAQRRGDADLALQQRADGLHDEQRVAARTRGDARGFAGQAGRREQLSHGGVVEQAEVDALGHAGQPGEGLGPLLGTHRGDDHEPRARAARARAGGAARPSSDRCCAGRRGRSRTGARRDSRSR